MYFNEMPQTETKPKEESANNWYPEEHITELKNIIERQKRESGFDRYMEREKQYISIREVERDIRTMSEYEITLNAFLRRYGLEGVARRIGKDIFAIQTNDESQKMLDRLPKDFVYVGGAARAALERSLGIDAYSTPRDIDIAVMKRNENNQDLLDELSERYMPEDFSHGYGVKKETEEYFETRDFTINQVFATREAIHCTKQCLLDTLRGVLRFTEYEKRDSYRGNLYYVHPKLLAKALRLAVVRDMKIADEDVYTFQEIDAFHIALHLDRSMEQGVDAEYIRELRDRKQIPENIQTTKELIDYLKQETSFVFRCVPKEEEKKEQEWLQEDCPWDAIEEKYQDMPLREGMGRRHS
jgi:hypothetical protein